MNPASILVVEDEVIVRKDILKTLEAMHYYPLYAAGTGDEAVEKARKCIPEIVLMDIAIPGTIDGLGAAQVIREDLDIPVIFVTSLADDVILERVKCLNPYGYVIKPFSERDIKVAIEIALSRKRSEMQERMRGAPTPLAGIAGKPGEVREGYTSLSDIRTLLFRGFFKDLVLLLYNHTEVKEQVFTSFIEQSMNAREKLLFAYSFSRAHKNFLNEVHKGEIRISRIKNSDLSPLIKTLSDYLEQPDIKDPGPQRIIIDFSERFDPADIRVCVDRIIAVRPSGVPFSGILALAVGTCDETLVNQLSHKIPHMVVATSQGTLISCADHSFPFEHLSFLPQPVVDQMVKKMLEPLILSFLEKPVSGNDILNGISERYNVSVPKARIYTQLYELRKRGYISMRVAGKSKVYSPTENGKVYIKQKLHEFNSVFQHILEEMIDRNTANSKWERKD